MNVAQYTPRQIKILEVLKKAAGLSPATLRWLLELVLESRDSAPPSARGHPVVHPSKKMGVALAVRSLHLEAARLVELEADPEVIGYFTEVGRVSVVNPESVRGGKNRQHSPDIVVVYRDHVVLEVCKNTSHIRREMDDPGERWKWARTDDGEYIFPPLAVAVAAQGVDVTVRVVTEEHVSRRLVDNLTYLAGYLQGTPTHAQLAESHAVAEAVKGCEGVTMSALLASGGWSVDAVQRAIAHRLAYVDLRRCSVRDPLRVTIYSTESVATLHATVAATTELPSHPIPPRRPIAINEVLALRIGSAAFESVAARVLLVGRQCVRVEITEGECAGQVTNIPRSEAEAARAPVSSADMLHDLQAKVAGILTRAGERGLAIAYGRADVLLKLTKESGGSLGFPLVVDENAARIPAGPQGARTYARWKSEARKFYQEYGCALAGLVPRHHDKGNRGDHFDPAVEAFVFQCLEKLQLPENVPQARTAQSRYDFVLAEMEAQRVKGPTGLCQISQTLFRKICCRFGRRKITLAAEGLASANQSEPPTERLSFTTPIHGTRFLGRCHCDHSPLSVAQVCALIGQKERPLFLDTAWLSVLVCSYTRKVLAWVISYSAPSWLTVSTLLRICVKRYGQLPVQLVLDNATEFRCFAMQQLIAWADIKVIWRILKKPGGGSIIERLFGATESQVFANLPGSTRLRTTHFFYASDMPPADHARLCLEASALVLGEYFDGLYDGKIHVALGCSPEQMRVASLATHGLHPERNIVDVATFRVLTMARPRNLAGTAKIQAKYGVQLAGFRYWHELFGSAENEGRSVPVRIDPDEMWVAYALVKGPGGKLVWVRARCRQLEETDYLPDLQRRFATEIAQSLALRRFLEHRCGRRAIANFVARWRRVPDTLEELARTLADARVREVLLGAPDAPAPETVSTTRLPDTPAPGPRREVDEPPQGEEIEVD